MKDFVKYFAEMQDEFEMMYHNELGMCGCGDPEGVKSFLHKLLLAHKKYRDNEYSKELSEERLDVIRDSDPSVILEFIFHVLNEKGFVEHGGYVGNSWFTEKGERLIDLLSYEVALQE